MRHSMDVCVLTTQDTTVTYMKTWTASTAAAVLLMRRHCGSCIVLSQLNTAVRADARPATAATAYNCVFAAMRMA
jgi:hypothetical protein